MTRDNGLMLVSVRNGSAEMTRQMAGCDTVLALYVDCDGRGSARSGAPVEEANEKLETFSAPASKSRRSTAAAARSTGSPY